MTERPFCFRDRGGVVTTDRAADGIAIAHDPVRIACGTPNGKHVRVAQESGRKRIVAKSAAPPRERGRLLLHPTSTSLGSAEALMIGSSSAVSSTTSS